MAKTLLGALALAALPSALAFRNTSPFFLFSTANLNLDLTDASIAEASQTTAAVLAALQDCPTKSYYVVEQAGVSSADYADSLSTPQLRRYMGGQQDEVKTRLAVHDVVGQVDGAAIVAHLQAKCGFSGELRRSAAPVADQLLRFGSLWESDDALDGWISKQARSEDYTVVYVTTPPTEATVKAQLVEEMPPYEMENAYRDSMHMELKRDVSAHVKSANSTTSAGLFERYQYFTPGLFMGFAAIIPLFLILLVGVRALTSLEVSYFAFSKEMGPNAQKKQ